jgi:hypothetical protein
MKRGEMILNRLGAMLNDGLEIFIFDTSGKQRVRLFSVKGDAMDARSVAEKMGRLMDDDRIKSFSVCSVDLKTDNFKVIKQFTNRPKKVRI